MRNIFYPKLRLSWLTAMLGYSLLGALVAGTYGILHDQITYAISPEYFTRYKFIQFHWANFGLSERWFVVEIGFLATWWVGFFSAWFIARLTVPSLPPRRTRRVILRGFMIVFAAAFLAGAAGYLYGLSCNVENIGYNWLEATESLGIPKQNASNFVRVGYIHNAGYLGGLAGLAAALLYAWIAKRAGSAGSRTGADIRDNVY
jgi:hypothetical protein